MKNGNWVPLSKALVKELPKDRPFSKVEAAFALQIDFDSNRQASIAGYAKQWKWSRKRVGSFFKELGIAIKYTESTALFQNQKGQIWIQMEDRYGADREQIILINNKDLQTLGSRSGADQGQIGSRSGYTTIKTNTNTKNKTKGVRGFSEVFLDEHWSRWTRLKKGGPYKNPEIETIALEELFTVSLGDEQIAANGLRAAIAAESQSFSWCFKSLDNRQSATNDRTVQHQGRPAENNEHFGADNIRWLELHARSNGP
jgi:hypothetical protein